MKVRQHVIPPMVVFSGKNFNHMLSDGEVPGTFYGTSKSGWMDQELFSSWFTLHFLQHAVSSRPLMLILDGHSSHFTLDLVKSAAEHDVIIFYKLYCIVTTVLLLVNIECLFICCRHPKYLEELIQPFVFVSLNANRISSNSERMHWSWLIMFTGLQFVHYLD